MSGYVYIARNPSFPHLVKVGQTRDLKKRMESLSSSSSAPHAFECLYSVKVENQVLLEKKIHEQFTAQRVSANKEFFTADPNAVKMFIESESKKPEYSKIIIRQIEPVQLKTLSFRELPAVLSKNDLRRITGQKDGHLRVSINRWVKQDIIKKAGERSGMYYNLVADPIWRNHVLDAVSRKFPSAMLAGPSVLHAYGLQTQIPSRFHVVVLSKRTLPSMEDVVWMPRPRKWYAENTPKDNLFGIRSLSPAQALKDGLDHAHLPGSWVPDMDDIDMEELEALSSKEQKVKKRSGL